MVEMMMSICKNPDISQWNSRFRKSSLGIMAYVNQKVATLVVSKCAGSRPLWIVDGTSCPNGDHAEIAVVTIGICSSEPRTCLKKAKKSLRVCWGFCPFLLRMLGIGSDPARCRPLKRSKM